MAVKIISTRQAAVNGVKILVYGRPGVGKTCLCATAPRPIILSAESGLLSLRHWDIPVVEINTVEDLMQAAEYLTGPAGAQYDTICLDSISEIAEVVLVNARKTVKDPRQAFGELILQMQNCIRYFRDLPRFNVYFAAKQEYTKDEHGAFRYMPSMPGQKLSPALPYFFDEVFNLNIGTDTKTGATYRYLRTAPDLQYEAKDRSGTLDTFEPANLTHIFNKITQGASHGMS